MTKIRFWSTSFRRRKTLLKQEWLSLWKDKKLTLSIVVMFIMPLLYSGMLLWAFWNPYGHLENLPVALVNNDAGHEFEGEKLALGDELIANLKDNATFKFMETSSEEANKMLANQEAYIVIEIPKNFSQHATTLLNDEPQKLELLYTVDEASNFLSSKIGDSAINQIQSEVNEEVATTYAEQLFATIEKLSDGYGDAADGAVTIHDGIAELQAGTTDLKGYLQQLASSTVTLAGGTDKLVTGVTSAKTGSEELVTGSAKLEEGGNKLEAGANDLEAGASSLVQGVTSYTQGVDKLATNQQALVEGQQQFHSSLSGLETKSQQIAVKSSELASSTEQLAAGIAALDDNLTAVLAQLPSEQSAAIKASLAQLQTSSAQIATGAQALSTNQAALQNGVGELVTGHSTIVANSEKLANGLQQVATNSQQLVAGATDVATGGATLSSSMADFNAGVSSLTGGIAKLDQGLGELSSGAGDLAQGTHTLSAKSSELADGSGKLVEGTNKLVDGTDELAGTLQQAKDDSTVKATDNTYEMVAAPVQVDKEIQNEVSNYGTGFAPYFISLGLFVGALLLTNVYPFVQPAVHPTGVLSWFISKSAVPFVVWIFQTTILSLFLLYGLQLEVTNLPLFIALMAVTSFAFIAIVQLFTVVLGDVGRFIVLVFLILQLASSAGTFPVELLPAGLQSIHTFMPMSYSVEALRHVISSTNYSVVYSNMALLGTIGVICVALSFAFFAMLYKRRYSKSVENA